MKVGDIVKVVKDAPYNLKIGEEFEVESVLNGKIRLKDFMNNLVGEYTTMWPEDMFVSVDNSNGKDKTVQTTAVLNSDGRILITDIRELD